ncbi:hypothetical protein FMO003_16660 [Moritella sp. F3]|nr:hypothetical protein FMO001_34140 [Moritella sp. F1]GIC81385.1 hypothetical protein FMO003_16660 [Moritella sp. F3]
MLILNKILLLLGVSLITFGSIAKPQIVTLELPTMNCPVCPITVTKSLEQVDGVTDVEVLYEKNWHRLILMTKVRIYEYTNIRIYEYTNIQIYKHLLMRQRMLATPQT